MEQRKKSRDSTYAMQPLATSNGKEQNGGIDHKTSDVVSYEGADNKGYVHSEEDGKTHMSNGGEYVFPFPQPKNCLLKLASEY